MGEHFSAIPKQKLEIIRLGRELYQRGYIVATGGNISIRLDAAEMLITVRGVNKGKLSLEDIVKCEANPDSAVPQTASSETAMHRIVYSRRPDISAVIHSHPPQVIACTVASIGMDSPVLPEILLTCGIPTAPFAPPSSPEGATAIQDLVDDHDIIVLDRHGAITMGSSLWDAFDKLERLEFYAGVLIAAAKAGRIRELTQAQIDMLTNCKKKN